MNKDFFTRFFYNIKLRKTIIISLLLGLSIPIFLGSYYIQQSQEKQMKEQLYAFHHYITNAIAKSMSTIVWDFRLDAAKGVLIPIFENPRITRITVWDSDAVFVELKKEVDQSETILLHSAPIVLAGKKIGHVEVGVTERYYRESLQNLNLLLAGIILAQIILALMLLLPILYLKVIKPVYRLIDQSEQIAENRLDTPFEWRQNDELGLLGQSFDATRTALSYSFDRLHESRETIRLLLDNSGEGFLSFDRDYKIDPTYSKECDSIFGEQFHGQLILELLAGDDAYRQKQLERNFDAIFNALDAPLKLEMLLALLPKEYKLGKCCYAASYSILENHKIMMRLSDITAEKALEAKLKEEQERLRFLVSVVQYKSDYFEMVSRFQTFLEEEFDAIAADKIPLEERVAEIYRRVHTFKGSFAQMDSPGLPEKLHRLEDTISRLREEELNANSFEKIQEEILEVDCQWQLNQEMEIIRIMLGEEFIESKGMIAVPGAEIIHLEKQVIEQFTSENTHIVLNEDSMRLLRKLRCLRYISIHSLLASYPKATLQVARRLGKEIKEFSIVGGEDILVDPERYQPFFKTLIHLFRNAVDHGIETPEERFESGKDEAGEIRCEARREKDDVVIEIRDDGRGIDREKLLEKARELGVEWGGDPYALLFMDSLSTKEEVTDMSGRGVGMAAVKSEVENLGGRVEIESDKTLGTCFRFILPL